MYILNKFSCTELRAALDETDRCPFQLARKLSFVISDRLPANHNLIEIAWY